MYTAADAAAAAVCDAYKLVHMSIRYREFAIYLYVVTFSSVPTTYSKIG